ncbi:MAG TPA: amidohydrolase family protein [Tepidisphaeraceae bacterium]|jgi:predicted TIM-barrel fold metal-dependent hydrolase
MNHHLVSRRQLLKSAGCAAAVAMYGRFATAADSTTTASTQPATRPWTGPIIDIHQHTTYRGRSDAALFHHQACMGVTQTVLLPAGTAMNSPSTLKGIANGLYAGAGPIDTVLPIVKSHSRQYFFFANEVPDFPEARKNIEQQLKAGAKGIGEQKFNLPCDSKEMELIYSLAQEYDVPILMHFEHQMFNTGYENFGKVLAKWPKVTFIGHAQTFWANIDAAIKQQAGYPKGKVVAGGLTDKYLTDYPNLFADMSAGSGLNALIRDEEHARGFIQRHYKQMMFGSDCADNAGFGPTCSGSSMISAIVRLSPSKDVTQQLLHDNAKALLKL